MAEPLPSADSVSSRLRNALSGAARRLTGARCFAIEGLRGAQRRLTLNGGVRTDV